MTRADLRCVVREVDEGARSVQSMGTDGGERSLVRERVCEESGSGNRGG